MDELERKRKKVLDFYVMLPIEIKNATMEKLTYRNREERRKFSKIKSIDSRITKMFESADEREILVNAAYIVIRDKVPLTLENATYEQIVKSINSENYIENTLFFFRWCYENSPEGLSNDIYFDEFVGSTIFERIIDGTITDNSSTLVNNESQVDTTTKQAESFDIVAMPEIKESEEVKKMKLEPVHIKIASKIIAKVRFPKYRTSSLS